MYCTVSIYRGAIFVRFNLRSLYKRRTASFPFQIKLCFLLLSLLYSFDNGKRSNITEHYKKLIKPIVNKLIVNFHKKTIFENNSKLTTFIVSAVTANVKNNEIKLYKPVIENSSTLLLENLE